MFRVDIYIVTKCSSNSKTLGKYGFVCTCAKKSGEIGKIQDTGQIKGTRHETEVKAITELGWNRITRDTAWCTVCRG